MMLGGKAASASQVSWQDLISSARSRVIKADCVAVKSEDPVYILHTSGTTGTPKGVRRDTGGHAVGLQLSIRYMFHIHGPGDVLFTASDIGWVVGHSYILYAPLLAGASTVLYEGKPVGTPDASAFWRVVEEYKVSTMFTAPTALRAVRNDDPKNKSLSKIGQRGGLRSLKALFLAGERSEPTLVSMYQHLLDRYGALSCLVIDNWWSTEAGSPITGQALMPHAGQNHKTSLQDYSPPAAKPGSAGQAMPGFDVRVVDDQGHEVVPGSMGNLVLRLPLAPTAFRTLWNEEKRFYESYLKRFDGRFFDTGDSGWIDREGYVHVMSRNDDVLNVSAYRLSSGTLETNNESVFERLTGQSGAIEQAISSHPLVTEACVVGVPDELKGQLPFAFISLTQTHYSQAVAPDSRFKKEIQTLVRKQVGAFACIGGMICGRGMIPKTRSGKTLRRVLRELIENGVHGEFAKEIAVPSTIEDFHVVEVARAKVKDYFAQCDGKHRAIQTRTCHST